VAVAVAVAAAFDVFGWFQVRVFDFDGFLFRLLHFNFLLSSWPSVNSRLENSFLAVH
jgi:hypothetical protein